MNETELIDLSEERALNEPIASLLKEEATPNNLWPDIKTRIMELETKCRLEKTHRLEAKYYTARWIPWAIAASLVVSLFSVIYSWDHLQHAESLYAEIENLKKSNENKTQERVYENSIQFQVDLLEQEFRVAKVGLLAQISMNRVHIDEKLFLEIKNQLVDIEQAVVLLKSAIKQQPDNSNLPRLLTSTYQQELAVLTQLAKLDTSI